MRSCSASVSVVVVGSTSRRRVPGAGLGWQRYGRAPCLCCARPSPPGTCGKPPGSFDAFSVAVLANSGLVHVLDGEVVVAGNVGECAGDDGRAVCAICEHVDGGVELILVGVVEVVVDGGECGPVVAGRGSEQVQR